jgi:cell division septum initiation protein DivIVA
VTQGSSSYRLSREWPWGVCGRSGRTAWPESVTGERDNVDVHAKLAELREVVEKARSMPMSASAVVNRGEVLGLIDEITSAVDSALQDSQRVLVERESVVDEGRKEAERIIADARDERARIISDTDVYRVAKRQAGEIVRQAQIEAEELRKETDDYVDAKLANFEITLERTTEAVKRGRERLAGRSAFDDLTSDAVDEIKLPEHLDT